MGSHLQHRGLDPSTTGTSARRGLRDDPLARCCGGPVLPARVIPWRARGPRVARPGHRGRDNVDRDSGSYCVESARKKNSELPPRTPVPDHLPQCHSLRRRLDVVSPHRLRRRLTDSSARLLPHPQIQHLHPQAERHRKVHIPLRQMLIQPIPHQHHTDQQQKRKRQHLDRRVLLDEPADETRRGHHHADRDPPRDDHPLDVLGHPHRRNHRVQREHDVDQHDLNNHAAEARPPQPSGRVRRRPRRGLVPIHLVMDLLGCLENQERPADEQDQSLARHVHAGFQRPDRGDRENHLLQTHDPGNRQKQGDARDHRHREADGADASPVLLRHLACQDRNEHDVVDPEDDFHRRERHQRHAALDGQQILHGGQAQHVHGRTPGSPRRGGRVRDERPESSAAPRRGIPRHNGPMNATRIVAAALVNLAASIAPAQQAAEPATDRTPALEAWESLRYGMFIHFGINTFVGDECPGGETDAAAFNPANLDVDQWIRVAHDAGMKYAVLTTKHCTGHCLWPSKLTDFTVAASPVKTDIVRAFVDACHAHDVKPGFYYLLGWDAHHQHRMNPEQYEAFCKGQLGELLTSYGPIQQVFLDIPFDTGPDMAGVLSRLYTHIKTLQPECLVLPNQDFHDGTTFAPHRPDWMHQSAGKDPVPIWPCDLVDGERTLPPATGHDPRITFRGKTYYLPMETCDTLCTSWFWQPGDSPRSARALYQLFRNCTDRHANLLLDVGPDRTGRIPDASVRRLMELRTLIDTKPTLRESIARGHTAKASNVFHGQSQWGPEKALDGDFGSRWAADDDQKSGWLAVDLGAERTLGSVFVSEAYNRAHAFQVGAPDGTGWKPIARANTIGEDGVDLDFAPVKASRIRLNITDAPGGPTIWEFQVFSPCFT